MKFLTNRIKAFEYALSGLIAAFKRETHVKIHMLATLAVIALGISFKITSADWIILMACCFVVISAELINTAIERTCDMITLEIKPQIKYIKDVSAGAVLCLCIGAVILACIIFGKYVF
jgi:undecaprenol kinase